MMSMLTTLVTLLALMNAGGTSTPIEGAEGWVLVVAGDPMDNKHVVSIATEMNQVLGPDERSAIFMFAAIYSATVRSMGATISFPDLEVNADTGRLRLDSEDSIPIELVAIMDNTYALGAGTEDGTRLLLLRLPLSERMRIELVDQQQVRRVFEADLSNMPTAIGAMLEAEQAN